MNFVKSVFTIKNFDDSFVRLIYGSFLFFLSFGQKKFNLRGRASRGVFSIFNWFCSIFMAVFGFFSKIKQLLTSIY